MALNDYYDATIVFSHPTADGEVVNKVNYQLTDIVAPAGESVFCSQLADAIRLVVEADLLPALSDAWSLLRVDVFNITQPSFQGTSASVATGAIAQDAVAIRSAVVVTKNTGLRGRSFRGRMFLPSPIETNQNAGVIDGAYANVMAAYVDELQTVFSITLNEFRHVVYSLLLDTGTFVISIEVKQTLGSIRGRQSVN